jgi:addiction module RelE/StbE family toxin
MKLRWLSPALSELDSHYEFIRRENSKAARRVFTQIRSATRNLSRFPESGRIGQVAGTRELVVPGLPYIVVYRVGNDAVEILRVFHAARNWPSSLQ